MCVPGIFLSLFSCVYRVEILKGRNGKGVIHFIIVVCIGEREVYIDDSVSIKFFRSISVWGRLFFPYNLNNIVTNGMKDIHNDMNSVYPVDDSKNDIVFSTNLGIFF